MKPLPVQGKLLPEEVNAGGSRVGEAERNPPQGIGSGGFHFIPPTLLEKEENKSHPLLKRNQQVKGLLATSQGV
jgi:hypothetical protein